MKEVELHHHQERRWCANSQLFRVRRLSAGRKERTHFTWRILIVGSVVLLVSVHIKEEGAVYILIQVMVRVVVEEGEDEEEEE